VVVAVTAIGGVATPAAAQAREAGTAAPVTGRLESVSCASAQNCWAVGTSNSTVKGHGVIEHWNGSAWQVALNQNPPGAKTSYLGGVSCADAANCWAAGFYYNGKSGTKAANVPYAEHWNGQTWSAVNLPYPAGETLKSNLLFSVSCPAANLCFADGGYLHQVNKAQGEASLIERWNGSVWQVVPTPAVPQSSVTDLQALSCASARDCWATGDWLPTRQTKRGGALGYHWNGAQWTAVKITSTVYPQVGALYSVSCPTAQMCMTTGMEYSSLSLLLPFAEQWDGSSWQASPIGAATSAKVTVNGVSCASPQMCVAVGIMLSSGAADPSLAEQWNGSTWATVPTPNPAGAGASELYGVSCLAVTNCWAVGNWIQSYAPGYPLIEHWNGTAWTITSS
jgi:hypothetical protein